MRRIIPLLLAVGLVASACGSGSAASVQTGGKIEGDFTNDAAGGLVAPDFTFTLHDGTEWRLSEQTHPVLMVFWADWCPNCARELPALDAISGNHDVTILAVAGRGDIGKAAGKAADWLSSGNIRWGYDVDHDLWNLFGATGTPTNVFLLPDGTVLGIAPGALPHDSLDDILAELTSLG